MAGRNSIALLVLLLFQVYHTAFALKGSRIERDLDTEAPWYKLACGHSPSFEGYKYAKYSDAVQAVNEAYLYMMTQPGLDVKKHFDPGCWGVFLKGTAHLWICNQNNDVINVRQSDLLPMATQIIEQCRQGDGTLGVAYTTKNWFFIVSM
ncbi:hypothetical protein X797_004261 [Metarhizium robertsii]|uniref:Uncharacterized protein n=1 Tax=Metarhizium robertsii TaxID=568076 RepID=A0A0A1V0P2_9HYPO|nr:hypothetical protein X797_004261 [Metarhizium robertsii]